jgi:hypothetical protein
MIRCLIRLRSAIFCTGGQSAIATNNCVGKGSSPWCREFELARVISFDPLEKRKKTELGSLEEQYPEKSVPAWKAIVIKSEETGRKIDHKMAREIVVEYLDT